MKTGLLFWVWILIGFAAVGTWVDGCWRWTIILGPTIHGRSCGVEIAGGYLFIVDLRNRPHGWGWQQHPPLGPALTHANDIAGFGWNRSPSIDYIVVPLWFVAAVCFGAGFYFPRVLRRRMVKGCCAHCGYDLRATPGRCPECGAVRSVEETPRHPFARRRSS